MAANNTRSKRIRETPVDVEAIEKAAEVVTGIPFSRKLEREKIKSFKEHFGCRPIVATKAWKLIQQYTLQDAPDAFEIKHLLWALTFLKTYSVEGIRASLAGAGTGQRPDVRTVRDWCWVALEALARLEPYVVSSLFIAALLRQPILSNFATPVFFKDNLGKQEKTR
jgi:hypothetical protein